MAMNCRRTLNCINLFEYFLLVSPPLKRVPIPKIKTIPTAIKRAIDKTFTNIPEIIFYFRLCFDIKNIIYLL